MAKKKSNLTKQELDYIERREREISGIREAIQEAAKFKKGDFLIAYYRARRWGQKDHNHKQEQVTNSYGAPKKFTVVYTDSNGIAYIKELNRHGDPVGSLIDQVCFVETYSGAKATDYIFEVDPDYADAIIMADEENFDAAVVHKAKSDLFKEITNHNKSLKVNCNDEKELIKFLQSLKVGDVIYKSIKTHFTILKIDPIPTSHSGNRLVQAKSFGQAQTSKGKIFDLEAYIFKHSAIYKGRPRSYNELKDLK